MIFKKNLHPIDEEIQKGKFYSPRERMELAEYYGVSTAYVGERINAKNSGSCVKQISLILFFLVIAYFIIQEIWSVPEVLQSSEASPRQRYEQLSPEGKAYVDEQMKKYDEVCEKSSDC